MAVVWAVALWDYHSGHEKHVVYNPLKDRCMAKHAAMLLGQTGSGASQVCVGREWARHARADQEAERNAMAQQTQRSGGAGPAEDSGLCGVA